MRPSAQKIVNHRKNYEVLGDVVVYLALPRLNSRNSVVFQMGRIVVVDDFARPCHVFHLHSTAAVFDYVEFQRSNSSVRVIWKDVDVLEYLIFNVTSFAHPLMTENRLVVPITILFSFSMRMCV